MGDRVPKRTWSKTYRDKKATGPARNWSEPEYPAELPELEEEDEQDENYSQSEAALRAAAQIVSQGFSDEAIAEAKTWYQKNVADLPFDVLEGGGASMGKRKSEPFDSEKALEKNWAEQRRRVKGAAEQWPKTDIAAGLGAAGVMTFAPIPGSRLAAAGRGGKALKKAYDYANSLRASRAAPRLLGEGALIGAGKHEERLKDDPLGAAGSMAGGAAANLALSRGFEKGGEWAGKAYGGARGIPGRVMPNKLKAWLEETAEQRARKAAVGQSKKETYTKKEYEAQKKDWREAGRALLDEPPIKPAKKSLGKRKKLVGWWEDIESIAQKTGQAKRKYGEGLDKMRGVVDDIMPHGGVLVDDIVEPLMKYHDSLQPIGDGLTARNSIMKFIRQTEKTHPTGRMLEKEVQSIKESNKYNPMAQEQYLNNQTINNKIVRALGDAQNKGIEFVKKMVKREGVEKLPRLEDRGQQKLRGETEDVLSQAKGGLERIKLNAEKAKEVEKNNDLAMRKARKDYMDDFGEEGKKFNPTKEDLENIGRMARDKYGYVDEVMDEIGKFRNLMKEEGRPDPTSGWERKDIGKLGVFDAATGKLIRVVTDKPIAGKDIGKDRAYDKIIDETGQFVKPSAFVSPEAPMYQRMIDKGGRMVKEHQFGQKSMKLDDKEKIELARNFLKDYSHYKDKYGKFADLSRASLERFSGDMSNRAVSPSDYGMGASGFLKQQGSVMGLGGGATYGVTGDLTTSILTGIVMGGANHLSRTRGNMASARLLDKIARVSDNQPSFAREYFGPIVNSALRSPAAIVATHKTLMSKDENYRNYFEETESGWP